MRQVFALARGLRWWLALSVLLGLCVFALNALQITMIGLVIDQALQARIPWWWVPVGIGVFAVVFLVRAGFAWLARMTAHRVATRTRTVLRDRLYTHILAMGPEFTSHERTGALTNLAVEGIAGMEGYLSRYVPQIILGFTVPVLLLGYVALLDPLVALVLLAVQLLLPLVLWLLQRAFGTAGGRFWETVSTLSAQFLDLLQGMTTLKMFTRSRDYSESVQFQSDKLRWITMDRIFITMFSLFFLEWIATLGTIVIASGMAAWRLETGAISLGMAFVIVLLSVELARPLLTLGGTFQTLARGFPAADRLFALLRTPPLIQDAPDAIVPENWTPHIRLEQVSFSYAAVPGNAPEALETPQERRNRLRAEKQAERERRKAERAQQKAEQQAEKQARRERRKAERAQQKAEQQAQKAEQKRLKAEQQAQKAEQKRLKAEQKRLKAEQKKQKRRGAATPEEITPEEITPEEVTPEEVAPEEVTPEEVAPEEVAPVADTADTAEPESTPEEPAVEIPGPLALNAVSFEIRPGETVALVGSSGAGKSSVINLLFRFYDPQAGQITLGGYPLTQLSQDWLRSQMTLAAQETYLFYGTIAENLRLAKPDATQAELEAAARSANIHNFIAGLPEGYDTQVGERGVLLSGGQAQRIALARTLLKDAPILVLDEATSQVDAETEAVIQAELKRLAQSKTVLMIAHRLSTVRHADRILVMDEGRILEAGTHAELLARSGPYARLIEAQRVVTALVEEE
ncbi:MAG: ATP-binding cassette domain-containing protein [Chloroflexaceae bacterium]